MADVISRLKLESGEFDSKIKRAAQGIQRMAEECHNAGGILNQLEDENRAYIQSLGSMATVATTAKGKLAELTAAFTDIRSQYNALSDEEKQGEFGQELNRQLEIMKGRINDAKTELSDINKELGNTGKQSQETGGFLDKLKDRFVVNLDAMKLFNVGLKAAEGALNVVKDAFLASEANVDMWGRTMEASEALYEGFCNALNRSDFSGFLSRIDEIVSAAKEAYNALDELGTYRTIQRPENAKRAAEETRLRTMLRTGRYIASTNGAKSAYGLKEGAVLTDEARAGYQRSLERLMTQTISETRRNISKTQNSVDKLYNKIASTSGISRRDFKNTIQNWDTYQSTFKNVQNFNDWNDKNVPWYVKAKPDAYALYVASHNPYYSSRTLAWRDFRDSGDTFNRAQSLAEESYGLSSQLYSSQMRNYRALNAGGGRSGGGGGRGGGRGGAAPYVPQTAVPLVGIDMPWWQRSIASPQVQDSMGMIDVNPSIQMQSPAWVQRGQKNPELTKIADTMDESAKLFSDINGGISSIVTGVETLGIEVPEGMKKMLSMVQGVTTILSGISSLMLIFNAHQTANTLTNIASVVGAGAAAAAMHRGGVVRAATGTVVPGNYGFDTVPALLTSGETVLTRAQAGNIASQLQQGSRSAGTPQARVSGEQIYLVLTNYLKRRGQGETLTF